MAPAARTLSDSPSTASISTASCRLTARHDASGLCVDFGSDREDYSVVGNSKAGVDGGARLRRNGERVLRRSAAGEHDFRLGISGVAALRGRRPRHAASCRRAGDGIRRHGGACDRPGEKGELMRRRGDGWRRAPRPSRGSCIRLALRRGRSVGNSARPLGQYHTRPHRLLVDRHTPAAGTRQAHDLQAPGPDRA